jgi:dihydroorotase-like cyclic amidohydrolase
MASGSKGKTLLTEKTAATLIRKIRKSGLQPELATAFIQTNAPAQHQDDYLDMWESFIDEARDTLESDHDVKLHDALSLLRRECNVSD